jgi:hypothetical protein
MLGLSAQNRAAPRPGQPMPPQAFGAARFLLPVSQCEFQLTGILESLTRDPWPVASDKRPLRCTGVAMSVAVGLLEVCRIRLSMVILTNVCIPDNLPQYWGTYHALCGWCRNRGSRYGG